MSGLSARLGANLKRLLAADGRSFKVIAVAAWPALHPGAGASTLSRWKNEVHWPASPTGLDALAVALGVDPVEFFKPIEP
jgi:hypothetical protein